MEPSIIGDIVKVFLQYGLIGVVALVSLWAYWQKDKQLAAERDARLNDGKEMLKMYYELCGETEKTLESAVNLILKQQKGV